MVKANRRHLKKTERVGHMLTYEEIYTKLGTVKKDYSCHKYQAFNDKFHWPRILETCNDIGVIYQKIYSNNTNKIQYNTPISIQNSIHYIAL